MSDNTDYELGEVKKLIGGMITGPLSFGEYFGFTVMKPDGEKFAVFVDCDPEGNGPGHLNVTQVRPALPKAKKKAK